MTPSTPLPHRLRALLRGEPTSVIDWIDEGGARGLASCLGVIVVGCAVYGAAVGLWRSPLQAAFVAVKMPLVLLLTAAGNAALNRQLSPTTTAYSTTPPPSATAANKSPA